MPSDSFDWYIVGWGGPITAGTRFSVGINQPNIVVPVYPEADALLKVTDGIRLQWQVDPHTAWYRLYIAGPDGYEFDKWVRAGEACNGTVCTLPTPLYLTNGVYSWYMLGWNAIGMGSWNSATNFSINTPAPSIIQRISPSGHITEPVVPFQWQADPNAGWYRLYVLEAQGRVLDQWLHAPDVCSGLTCTFDKATITDGTHQWWMNAWSPGGEGQWDLDLMAFQIDLDPTDPVTLMAPANNSTVPAGDTIIRWQRANNAAWYHIKLQSDNKTIRDTWVHESQVCSGDQCTTQSPLKIGTITLTMQAWGRVDSVPKQKSHLGCNNGIVIK